MATAAKKTPPKLSQSRAIQPWEEEMAKAAKRQASVEKPMGLFKQVAVKGGVMYIDEKPIPGNKFDAVVLCATHENQWYNKPYNPNVPAVPACYAFGDQTLEDPEAEMAPSKDVEEIQGDEDGKCVGCWANKMGSADLGRGKACQNVRRLILVTADAVESVDALKDAEARAMKIPVMSVKNWVAFVHELDEMAHRPSYGAVVQISCVPDPKSQWQIKFAFQELITFDADLYETMKKRVGTAGKEIASPYPKMEDQPEPPPARGGNRPAAKVLAGKPGPAGKKVVPIAPARKAGKY